MNLKKLAATFGLVALGITQQASADCLIRKTTVPDNKGQKKFEYIGSCENKDGVWKDLLLKSFSKGSGSPAEANAGYAVIDMGEVIFYVASTKESSMGIQSCGDMKKSYNIANATQPILIKKAKKMAIQEGISPQTAENAVSVMLEMQKNATEECTARGLMPDMSMDVI